MIEILTKAKRLVAQGGGFRDLLKPDREKDLNELKVKHRKEDLNFQQDINQRKLDINKKKLEIDTLKIELMSAENELAQIEIEKEKSTIKKEQSEGALKYRIDFFKPFDSSSFDMDTMLDIREYQRVTSNAPLEPGPSHQAPECPVGCYSMRVFICTCTCTQVCMEPMVPPMRIFQCKDGHLLCQTCRSPLHLALLSRSPLLLTPSVFGSL